MKFAILNPNTHAGMTTAVATELARHLPPGTELAQLTAREGPAVIASRATYEAGAASALRLASQVPEDAQAVLLACFGDPGLQALRHALPMPVVGLAEAAMQAATRRPGRFAVITAGREWHDLLHECAHAYGATDQLLDVYTLDADGSQLVRDPERFAPTVEMLCRRAADAGASTVIFGGAAFAGLHFQVDARLEALDVMAATAAVLQDPKRPVL